MSYPNLLAAKNCFKAICLSIFIISSAAVELAPSDPRVFEYEVLDNGLEMLLIHDPDAKEAAAAMYVQVGSQSDPEGFEGLAHFLEHMLFIGTEKYPQVDALSEFVSAHGGSYNAFTARDHTQYYFSVKPEYFEQGMDRFLSFFIEPLFSRKYVDREVNAVNSEFLMHKQSDGWRQYYLSSVTGNPESSANQFNIGNLETLKDSPKGALRKALVDFYEKHYSSDRMYFVAVSSESIDSMKTSIKKGLLEITKRPYEKESFADRLRSEDMAQVIKMKGLSNKKEVGIQFKIPSQREQYLSPAAAYIAGMIGDEGKGSIYSYLRNRGWATGLSSGHSVYSDTEDLFNIDVELSDEGYLHKDEVLSAIFSYIDILQRHGVSISRFHEMQKLGYLNFIYYTPRPALNQANAYVSRMPYYPEELIVKAGYVTDADYFDVGHIHSLLEKMTLSNARVWFISPDNETDTVEPIFGTEYSVSKISDQQTISWMEEVCDLALPKANQFIPDELAVVKQKADFSAPEGIVDEPQSHAYFYGDSSFNEPRQVLRLSLGFRQTEDAFDLMGREMLSALLQDAVKEKLYPANVAGLGSNISFDNSTLLFSVWGLGNKHEYVMQVMIDQLLCLNDVSEDSFELIKADLLSTLSQIKLQRPIPTLSRVLVDLLSQGGASLDDCIEALSVMRYSDFMEIYRKALSDVNTTGFYYGNLTEEQALRYHDAFDVFEHKGMIASVHPKMVLELPQDMNEFVSVQLAHDDYAIWRYYQLPNNTYKSRATAKILSEMLSPLVFQQLRTEEQIGYAVRAMYSGFLNWPGISILVQSPNMEPVDISDRIDVFLNRTDLLSEDAFETLRHALIIDMEHPFKRMYDVNDFYWGQIELQQFDYSYKENMAQALKDLTFDDIVSMYKDMVSFKIRSIDLIANASKDFKQTISFNRFKQRYGDTYLESLVSDEQVDEQVDEE